MDPASSVARLYFGRVLYNRGLNDKALSVLTEASVLSPDHAEVHYVLGFVYGDLGHHEAARAATRKAIALNSALGTAQPNLLIGGKRGSAPPRPAGGSAAGRGAGSTLQAHLSLAVAFRKRGYLAEALREYRLALEAGEDEATALEGTAETHLLRKDFGAAIDLYDRLLQRQPGNPELWNERGYPFFGLLSDGLRTGKPQNEIKDSQDLFAALYLNPERLRLFLRSMTGHSSGLASRFV